MSQTGSEADAFADEPLVNQKDVQVSFTVLWFKAPDALEQDLEPYFANAESFDIETYNGGPNPTPDGFTVTYTVIGASDEDIKSTAVSLVESTLDSAGLEGYYSLNTVTVAESG